jgi:hypothetical protein
MKKYELSDFKDGWIIGNFKPSLLINPNFEVALKSFKEGESEPSHRQKIATEWTVVIHGQVKIGIHKFCRGQIIEIPPLEDADFVCLEDAVLLVIKVPSIPNDKEIL